MNVIHRSALSRAVRAAGVILLLGFASCSAWSNYIPPADEDFHKTSANCMSIGTQNLSPDDSRRVLAAAAAVCRIIASERFAADLKTVKLFASCDGASGQPAPIESDTVVAQLREAASPQTRFSIVPVKPPCAIGLTDRSNMRVAINPERILSWDGTENGGPLVETLAHEFVHIIADSYRDRGHGESCPEARLVSYRVGTVAAKLWKEEQRNVK